MQRLLANGRDAITIITLVSLSCNLELDHGVPVRLNNATTGETLHAGQDGLFH